MDPGALGGAHRVPTTVDVGELGARETRDDRAIYRPRDRLYRLEVALAGDGEPGLDHVDAEPGQLLRDLELLGHVERDARRLLAVAQRGVEDRHSFGHGLCLSCWCEGNKKPLGPEAREVGANAGGRSPLGKQEDRGDRQNARGGGTHARSIVPGGTALVKQVTTRHSNEGVVPVIRRTFRLGLRIGLLLGLIMATVALVRRRSTGLAPDDGPDPWVRPTAAPPKPAWVEPVGNACPASYPVKAKNSSRIYHVVGGVNYERTVPDRCYRDEAAAEADGFVKSKR